MTHPTIHINQEELMADKEIERIKLLYDYEKFHIGLYGGLIASSLQFLSSGIRISLLGIWPYSKLPCSYWYWHPSRRDHRE